MGVVASSNLYHPEHCRWLRCRSDKITSMRRPRLTLGTQETYYSVVGLCGTEHILRLRVSLCLILIQALVSHDFFARLVAASPDARTRTRSRPRASHRRISLSVKRSPRK